MSLINETNGLGPSTAGVSAQRNSIIISNKNSSIFQTHNTKPSVQATVMQSNNSRTLDNPSIFGQHHTSSGVTPTSNGIVRNIAVN